jgi:hypothetical protein
MFYYTENESLLRRVPKNFFNPDGVLMINFDQNNAEILSDYGFYTVRNDNSEIPENCEREDVTKRSIVLDKPYADITRVWIEKPKEDDNVL